ncbi:VOC family protein [Microterricola viridarii]|uniref:Glyoxalase n=1 Tax=Microterricola viridarii TaxID=412690 RepID=A0A0X8E368_9MICO|nr:VOC family protein [Microterricola viridarii]AMB58647.1 glyoxalase [Microterricola viridarii]
MTVRLDLIGFVVADMAASLDFYRKLGLEIPAGAESEDHVELTLPGGLRLGWDTIDVVKSFDPDWVAPVGGHRMVPAFLCDSPAELDALFSELVGDGAVAHKEPWDAFWGQRYAILLDPDGNSVELFAPLPE